MIVMLVRIPGQEKLDDKKHYEVETWEEGWNQPGPGEILSFDHRSSKL